MFNTDNTADYSTSDLAMMNRVLADYIADLVASNPDDYIVEEQAEKWGSDKLADAFYPGIDESDLRSAAGLNEAGEIGQSR